MICISISHIDEIPALQAQEVELAELRLDQINREPEEIYSLVPSGWKTIATCRPEEVDEEKRLRWLTSSMDLGAQYIDIELESTVEYIKALRTHAGSCGTQLIISYHNFEETPGHDLLARNLESCFERGGDIAKIATAVHSTEDLLHLIRLYELPGKKVVIGMGGMGRILRLMAPYLGAEFTYASPRKGVETAPGQLDLGQLLGIYKMIDES
jgi:3-dehydroquinate dehydratase type I